jgi:hypothetical protein
MRRLLFLLAFGTGAALAEDHAHHHGAPPPGDAPLVVTINPEARVSVVIGAPMPPPPPCGTATELKVKVINHGFVTAPLKAEIVGDGNQSVELHMDSTKLSGEPEDSRVLHLTALGPDLADVTIAFSIDTNIGDLGGRDRAHVLVSCREVQ